MSAEGQTENKSHETSDKGDSLFNKSTFVAKVYACKLCTALSSIILPHIYLILPVF